MTFVSLVDEDGDKHLVALDSIADVTFVSNEERVGLLLAGGLRIYVTGTVDGWKTWLTAHGQTVATYP